MTPRLVGIWIILLCLPIPAQDTATSPVPQEVDPVPVATPPPPPPGSLFRIAHVRTDEESPFATETLDRLRMELSGTASVRAAMDSAGIADIVIQTADTYQNLIDAMNQDQPDLVFCTSVAYVTQSGEYDVLFQVRRKRDVFSPRGDLVLHRGVVLAGNRSPLFSAAQPEAALPAAMERGPVAMVGSFSAAGYIYPALRLRSYLPPDQDWPPPAFLGSSEEVVKAVLNGTVELGACDAGTLESVLAARGLQGMQNSLVRVVLTTDAVPTDPVVIRTRWRPGTPGAAPPSILGREIRDGIRRFFHRQPDMPRMEPGSNDRYRSVSAALDKLRAVQPAARPPRTSTRPASAR